jgi:hypothetical protein
VGRSPSGLRDARCTRSARDWHLRVWRRTLRVPKSTRGCQGVLKSIHFGAPHGPVGVLGIPRRWGQQAPALQRRGCDGVCAAATPTLAPTTSSPTFLLGGTAREPAYVRRSNLCARARLRVDATSCVCARCAMVLTHACVPPCVGVRLCVCVRACQCVQVFVCVSVSALPWHGGDRHADRRAGGRVCALRLSPRSGRRGDVGEPHGERGMGCAIWAHIRDRRRRHHLRHRWPQRHHRLQRRLGEHRRRCAT